MPVPSTQLPAPKPGLATLHSLCTPSWASDAQVEKGTFHLRVDTSTLVAVIAAKFTSVEMVRGQVLSWLGEGEGGGRERVDSSSCVPGRVRYQPAAAWCGSIQQLILSSLPLPRCAPNPACSCLLHARSTRSCCTLGSAASSQPSRCGCASKLRSRCAALWRAVPCCVCHAAHAMLCCCREHWALAMRALAWCVAVLAAAAGTCCTADPSCSEPCTLCWASIPAGAGVAQPAGNADPPAGAAGQRR